MKESTRFRKMLAYGIVIFLAIFVLIAFYPYIKGLFGALILFILFRPFYTFLVRRRVPKKGAAAIVILATICIVLIPLFLIIFMVAGEVSTLFTNIGDLGGTVERIDSLLPQINLESILMNQLDSLANNIQDFIFNLAKSVYSATITIVMMYAILFYMLINCEKLPSIAYTLIPFNRENSERLMNEFTTVTKSTVIATGLIALLQGSLLSVAFMIFDVPGALFWGAVGVILSFLPIIGVPVLWVPAAIFQFTAGDMTAGFGILVFGSIISSIDNFIRPILQEKVGAIHPLITFIGVFIGIPLFNIVGIFIGPLMLSYTILTFKMFREEYLHEKGMRK